MTEKENDGKGWRPAECPRGAAQFVILSAVEGACRSKLP
jgi:hypothetical protein